MNTILEKMNRRMKLEMAKQTKAFEKKFHLTSLILGPTVIEIELTPKCNLSCFMCHRNSGPIASTARAIYNQKRVNNIVGEGGFISREIFEKALKLTKNTTDIRLSGYGEPMLHPDFIEYARRIKELGKVIHTITNGVLMNETISRDMAAMDFDWLCVSIDASTAKTYKEIRNADLKLVLKNIERLTKLRKELGKNPNKPGIGVNFVAMKKNIKELPELVEICAGIGVSRFAVCDLEIHNRKELEKESLHNNQKLAEKYCSIAAEKAKKNGIQEFEILLPYAKNHPTALQTNGPKKPNPNEKCSDFFDYAYVTWNGKILSCCLERFGIGDLNINSAQEIWNGKIIKELRARYYREGIQSVCPGCFRIK